MKSTQINLNVIFNGLAVGLDKIPGLTFNKDKPFRACLICGAVYQSDGDRAAITEQQLARCAWERQQWANKHKKKHSVKEHEALKMSGNTMTPEAAFRLAAFGLIPAVDAVTSDEINKALYESSSIPINDAES